MSKPTFTTLFCGAGGDAIGLEQAGFKCVLAVNHWERAIETHAANFPNAEHLCADINHLDMRNLPPADVLWASVICTELSPSGGRKRKRGQMELWGHVSSAGFERTRACALDVIRACSAHDYKAVIVENVVEFARDWELFGWWLDGMAQLGYVHEIVSASSAHLYGDDYTPAPQWRDRIYIVFTRKGMRRPDLEVRPWAICEPCGDLVEARQSWKRTDRAQVGKFGQQYLYRCPTCTEVVEPLVMPAASAIDWTDLGQRIGDRPKPLAEATMRRIRAGFELFAQPLTVAVAGGTYERPGSGYARAWPTHDAPMRTRTCTAGDALATPMVLNVNHQGDDGRPFDPSAAPLPPRTTKIGDGLAMPEPFITMLRENGRARGIDDPLAAISTGRNHMLTVPGSFVVKNHGSVDYKGVGHMVKGLDEPLAALVAKVNTGLVIPYRRGRAKSTAEPLLTLATHDSAAVCRVTDDDVMNAFYRMLQPRESLRGQGFHDEYDVKGNKGERTMQAGNAVSVNAARWAGERLIEVL